MAGCLQVTPSELKDDFQTAFRSLRLQQHFAVFVQQFQPLVLNAVAAGFSDGGEPQDWWRFTAQRKAYLAQL